MSVMEAGMCRDWNLVRYEARDLVLLFDMKIMRLPIRTPDVHYSG